MNLSRRRKSEDKDAYRIGIDKKTLLALTLSSSSFLDSTISDSPSAATPLYRVCTVTTSTSILRTTSEGTIIAADIRWVKQSAANNKRKAQPGTLVQMKGGRWQAGENFLTPHSMLSVPQFRIPGFSHSLKWKRLGNSYNCATSTVKGPIAILDLATPTSPYRLSVYETLHDKYDNNPLSSYNGVSLLLLDYLITSALLLVTGPQEWMVIPKSNDATKIIARLRETRENPKPERSQTYGPSATPAAGDQWRKVVRGEPGYPSIKHQASAMTLNGKMPTASSEQMRKVLFGEALFPKRRPQSLSSLSLSDSDTNNDELLEESMSEFTLGFSSGPPWLSLPQETMSPSAESTHYPRPDTPSAPHHAYLDPSFYNSPVPPVPPLPSIYRTHKKKQSNEMGRPSQDSLLEPMSRTRLSEEQHIRPSFARRIVHSPSNSTISTAIDISSPISSAAPPIRARRLPQLPTDTNEPSPLNTASIRTIQKRSSSYSTQSIRSLPPTPLDAQAAITTTAPARALSPPIEKSPTVPVTVRPRRESTFPGTRDSVFEPPPPAYHAIDFARSPSNSSTAFRALPQPPSQH